MKISSNRIKENRLQYCKIHEGEIIPEIWELLEQGAWKNVNPYLFEENTAIGELNRSQSKPIINNLLPVYPGMVWDKQHKKLIDPFFSPSITPMTKDDFLSSAEQFFDQYSGKHFGVHLSGGLDSSIIIALLKYFNLKFSLVGMTSNRYEFRTEKTVQNILSAWGKQAVLLEYEYYLPLSALDSIPAHQYPDILCMNYNANTAMANECQKLGIEVLLTGNGGDNVFAEAVPYRVNECAWMPQIFIDAWLDDYAYAPFGIEVVPFYADKGIMNAIFNLRLGHNEDNKKLWTRSFFKDILPKELVDYTYCADFWGLYIEGLLNALPTLKTLFEKAYELTEHECFSKKEIKSLLDEDIFNAHKTKYQKIESRATIAIWLNSLFKNN